MSGRSFLKSISHLLEQTSRPRTRLQNQIEFMTFEQQCQLAKQQSLKEQALRNNEDSEWTNPQEIEESIYRPRRNKYRNFLDELSSSTNGYMQDQAEAIYQNDLSQAIQESLKEKEKRDEQRMQMQKIIREEEKRNQSIRDNQNDEYETLLQETIESLEKEYNEKLLQRKQDEENELKKNQEKEKKLLEYEKIKEAAKRLPPEPKTGITIAVVLPNQKRIIRKFGPDELAQNIFTWASTEESLIKDDIYPKDFDLICPFSPPLDPAKTLSEQGIKRSVLFNVQIKE